MGRVSFILGVLAAAGVGVLAGYFVGQKAAGPQEPNPTKQADLKWSREVAQTFLQSLVDHEGGGALDLSSPGLRLRFGLTPSQDRYVRTNAIDNFYRFCGYNGYGLRLVELPTSAGMPEKGRDEVVVASMHGELHFRVFDNTGKMIADTDETKLTDNKALVDTLRGQVQTLLPPHRLLRREMGLVIQPVLTLVGVTQRPAYGDDPSRHDRFTLDKEEIAPDKDEAIFRGTLTGPNRSSPFSIVVSKDPDNNKWRVNNLALEDH